MSDNNSVLVKVPTEKFGQAIVDTKEHLGQVAFTVKVDSLLDICSFVKSDTDLNMDFLTDIIGVDYHPKRPRFEIVYQLYSTTKKHRLRLKVKLGDGDLIPSVTGLWNSANWAEREIYDMYGVKFEGHPDMRRIYMPDDWEGYPLRKDYPLVGYKDEYNPNGEEKKEQK